LIIVGFFGSVFELAPKSADLHVHRPIVRPGLAIAGEIGSPARRLGRGRLGRGERSRLY
jgi:hypothetical protein